MLKLLYGCLATRDDYGRGSPLADVRLRRIFTLKRTQGTRDGRLKGDGDHMWENAN